ncbi:MAG: sugar ABC transporter permease [Pleurocapsa minor GSE-CHR-MK-17-07R]|jgi:alpha-1,4-digalacturonate transport system permease protein|nr:sugar ABC transporter permease [Pleurocapsa minor GSE-CHR-MK 17-07R]
MTDFSTVSESTFEERSFWDRLGAFIISVLVLPLALLDGLLSRLQARIGIQRMGYWFILPNLLIFGTFILLPMLLNFYYGFTGGTSILPQNRTWVGTENLSALLTCEDYTRPLTCTEDLFWRGAANTVRFVVIEVTAIILLSLVTAVALNRRIRARGFFRSVFFYPVLLSPVVVALIWKWILQPQGVLNSLLADGRPIPFLTNADWAMFWVIVVHVWAQMGFYTLILLAGLQAIPKDLYEAASMDGANEWSRFWHITLPLLRPTMLVVLVLTLIRSVQVFDLAFVFTGGGPGTATQFLVQFIFQSAFDDRRFGIAAGASLLLAGTLLVFTIIQLRVNRSSLDNGEG